MSIGEHVEALDCFRGKSPRQNPLDCLLPGDKFDIEQLKMLLSFRGLELKVLLDTKMFLKSAKSFELSNVTKRALEKSHELPQIEKWFNKIMGKNYSVSKHDSSLVNLLLTISNQYLNACIPIILYDQNIQNQNVEMFDELFQQFPTTFYHGTVVNNTIQEKRLLIRNLKYCRSFILFSTDIMNTPKIIPKQHSEYVIVVSQSSQWRIQEFLSTHISHVFVNLLVIGESFQNTQRSKDTYILYTHRLHIDGLGSSASEVLTAWIRTHLTRPAVNLFPSKLEHGVAGHRFIVGVAHHPPFVVKRLLSDVGGGNKRVHWDGIEIRLLKMLSTILNFTLEFKDVMNKTIGPGYSVEQFMKTGKGDVGVGGIYTTPERIQHFDLTAGHTEDCASFVSLTSTALPKYRAIMGPFQWTVWVALTFTYLIGIIPLSFSDKHDLRYLIDNPGQIESMFWYVFGTFTNCFTFTGKQSWSRSKKVTTRLLIGWYWAFTIIITACYTGSIIAFVTLPVFPETIDTTDQLVNAHYRIITLNNDGWSTWFMNSSDNRVVKLMKNLRVVPDVQTAVYNITHAFFWPYAFLGSRANLDYMIRTNFSVGLGKRSLLHVSDECFVAYSVSIMLPLDSLYTSALSSIIQKAIQAGLLMKINNDVKWDLYRSPTGKLLQIGTGSLLKLPPPEDKALTLDDTQGMFLLLGAGFIIALTSLISEYVGGCVNYCKRKQFFTRKNRTSSVISSKSFHLPSPKRKIVTKPSAYNHVLNDSTSDVHFDTDTDKDNNNVDYNSTSVLIHNHQKSLDSENDEDHRKFSYQSNISADIDKLFNLDEWFGEKQSYHPHST
ncbi:ionotropic receptor 21a [Chrysoperla carnea]|uniref:ionotropic receptor 21a n=1 Tax=Chrysoperla carnea TaxID=189513 RepID=UPI001D098D1D|nr:ionotropic receptor 21a [Chrysoperla carnea]